MNGVIANIFATCMDKGLLEQRPTYHGTIIVLYIYNHKHGCTTTPYCFVLYKTIISCLSYVCVYIYECHTIKHLEKTDWILLCII